jgi:transposase
MKRLRGSIERSQMMAQKDETASRLVSIPGFGPITASAMMPTIQDTTSFAGPREFAAFLGLSLLKYRYTDVQPARRRQHSTSTR